MAKPKTADITCASPAIKPPQKCFMKRSLTGSLTAALKDTNKTYFLLLRSVKCELTTE